MWHTHTILHIYKKKKTKKKYKYMITNCLKFNNVLSLRVILLYLFIYMFQVYEINFSFYQTVINFSNEIIILTFFLSTIWLLVNILFKNKFVSSSVHIIQYIFFLLIFFLFKENVSFSFCNNIENFYNKFYTSSELAQGPSLYHGVFFLCINAYYLQWLNFKKKSNVKCNKNTIFQNNSYYIIIMFLCFFVYSFVFGAYWAFFSNIWGYWFNWDPVELFLLFLILISAVNYHTKYSSLNTRFFKLSNLFLFHTIFLWSLRLGYLNSRHASSANSELSSNISFIVYKYFFIIICITILGKLTFYKKKKNSHLNTCLIRKKIIITNLYTLCLIALLILFTPQNTNIFWKYILSNNFVMAYMSVFVTLLWHKYINKIKYLSVWSNGHGVIFLTCVYVFNVMQSHVYTNISTINKLNHSISLVNISISKGFWFCYSWVCGKSSAISLFETIDLRNAPTHYINHYSFFNNIGNYYPRNMQATNKLQLYTTGFFNENINNLSYLYQGSKNETFKFVKNSSICKFDSLLFAMCYLITLVGLFLF